MNINTFTYKCIYITIYCFYYFLFEINTINYTVPIEYSVQCIMSPTEEAEKMNIISPPIIPKWFFGNPDGDISNTDYLL